MEVLKFRMQACMGTSLDAYGINNACIRNATHIALWVNKVIVIDKILRVD